MDLKVGDPITVVLYDLGRPSCVHTKVSDIHTIRGAIVLVVSVPISRYYHNEGISWCRGHDGPAVEALKVALALG